MGPKVLMGFHAWSGKSKPPARLGCAMVRRMGPAKRGAEALARFRDRYGERVSYLHHRTPFQLLVAVILSAQSTDAGVNRATPALFRAYPDAERMAKASVDDLFALIGTVNFARAKARHLQGMARQLVERHGGEVPRTMADLTSLPGVGRKTASVVQGYVHGEAETVAVDTHVARVAERLGLTSSREPRKAERELEALYPRAEWPDVNYYFIAHGRAICRARRPLCEECLVKDVCPKVGVDPAIVEAAEGPKRASRAKGA